MTQGLSYYQTNDDDGKPLLSLRSALAFDIFSRTFGPEVFTQRPLERPDSLREILQACLEAADFLIASAASEPH
jgi:hypothetical protein